MRRLLTFAMASLTIVSFAASSYALTTKGTKTVTAAVTFNTAGTVDVSIVAPDGGMTWTGVNPGVTKWKVANGYIVLHSTITDATGGVRIYTDNKNASATPKYTGALDNAAGLVLQENTAKDPLPMCWRIVDESTTTLNISEVVDSSDTKIVHLYTADEGLTSKYPCFMWMTDIKYSKVTSGDANTLKYLVAKDQANGIQHAENTFGVTSSPDYIYVGAKFKDAVTSNSSRTYKTTIYIEAFTE